MSTSPIVYSIVVTYNGQNYIKKCLAQLLLSTINVSVVVVDNCSTDETVEIIKTYFQSVTLIPLDTNTGFGRANNIGIKYAHDRNADFIFLLNQDVYVEKDTIAILVKIAIKNKGYGVLSPMHLNGNGDMLDHNFQAFTSSVTQLWSDLYTQKHKVQELYMCGFVNAAAWLVSSHCISSVGGFDPLFFHYGEDNDFINRVIFRNLRIGICPHARIFHDRGYGNKLNNQSELDVRFLFTLIHLKNINNKLSKLSRDMYVSCLSELVASILNFRFGRITLLFQLVLKIIANMPTIYLHRNRSKEKMAFLTPQNGIPFRAFGRKQTGEHKIRS
jgi:GT2 family glycosyltransferase